jgi:hypothetical protein
VKLAATVGATATKSSTATLTMLVTGGGINVDKESPSCAG